MLLVQALRRHQRPLLLAPPPQYTAAAINIRIHLLVFHERRVGLLSSSWRCGRCLLSGGTSTCCCWRRRHSLQLQLALGALVVGLLNSNCIGGGASFCPAATWQIEHILLPWPWFCFLFHHLHNSVHPGIAWSKQSRSISGPYPSNLGPPPGFLHVLHCCILKLCFSHDFLFYFLGVM